jgi:hypothetical protein
MLNWQTDFLKEQEIQTEKVFGRILLDLWDGSGSALFQDGVHCLEPQMVRDFIIISNL